MARKEIDRRIPAEPGIYWARTTPGHHWYNAIIEIHGTVPFLKCRMWDRVQDKIYENISAADYYFGPKIGDPDVPKEEIA